MVVVVVVDSFFREFDATKLDHTKKLTPPPQGDACLCMHGTVLVALNGRSVRIRVSSQ